MSLSALSAWSLPPEAFGFLRHRLEAFEWTGSYVVELGSGEGSALLAEICRGKLISIEHDPAFVESYSGGKLYHAPIVNGWYDPEVVSIALAGLGVAALIVDGPPGAIGRAGLLDNLNLFPAGVPMLIDDIQRPAERDLALEIAKRRNETLTVHFLRSGRAFATIGFDF